MTNRSQNSYLTLREAIINLGYEWHENDYFFCHGELPIIENATADMKEYVGILLCTDGLTNSLSDPQFCGYSFLTNNRHVKRADGENF